MVIWRNQNFIRQVTGHTGWRIDLIATVVVSVKYMLLDRLADNLKLDALMG